MMTLVKVWLADATPTSREKAAGLLARLREFLESTHNTVFLIETWALQAILDYLEGNNAEALAALKKALILALPGTFIRLFVDLGPTMAILLYRLEIEDRELAAYRQQILNSLGSLAGPAPPSPGAENRSQQLVELLTDRELDVLILLEKRQTYKEIAEKLSISHHTVRSHTKNIYAKLGVNNRRQAAARAQELGLLKPN